MEKDKVRAPEFKAGLDWLNIDKPLKIKELKGKIILIDFWTYCCINCMHILPELKKLEEKYKNELVVIGVHSAKFNTEKGTENIRQAILRYNIAHPVVNDYNFDIWRQYGANAWPTLILIDPNGYIVGAHSGEGIYDIFDYHIEKIIKEHKDIIDYKPIELSLEKDKKQKSFISFPGKISADKVNKRLVISDSGNNRIILADTTGNIIDIIGTGKQGYKDGTFEEAEFNSPQGTVVNGNFIYIADTDNHTIRKADLLNRTVETIAGLGYQVYTRKPYGKGINTGLNSPWDLTIVDSYLYIAMAGPHQIWKLDLSNNDIYLHAGNGYENIVDGNLLSAQLAQPSGITSDGKYLYFADSEVSAIRKADIDENGKVLTLIGTGLFDFGDKDGNFKNALLQHPIGIVYNNNKLYIADTYNNKIKELDLLNNKIITLAGNGKEGSINGKLNEASFNEPAGLTILDDLIYLADTNNDLIRVIDLKNNTVFSFILKPKEIKNKIPVNNLNYANTFTLNYSDNTTINIKLTLPNNTIINPHINSFVNVFDYNGKIIKSIEVNSISTSFNLNLTDINSPIIINTAIYYCDKSDNGLCYIIDNYYKVTDTGETSILNINVE
jgi:thiol-disulfide isomerase/thioredoxin